PVYYNSGTRSVEEERPIRVAYSLTTTNLKDRPSRQRIGLDLCSDVFGHGQLYVALSRARNRASVLCRISPTYLVNGVLYVANVVKSPFVQAAVRVGALDITRSH
ncbi:unnamed protein product, partial [Scytosiphon promiscuus]